MKSGIRKPDFDSEFYIAEGCHIVELSNTPGNPGLSIARARVESGVTTRWHRLRDTAERYYILDGKGSVEIGELDTQEVNPGDIVIIPPMCPQRITNTGAADLVFLAICTPRFCPDNYEDIEEDNALQD